jgi:pyruvate dehydrogenase E2 component (dihydrolipoamide acetyltransferase)
MSTPVHLPRLAQSMTEAVISAWAVEPGAEIASGDVLLTAETDKTEFELESPGGGYLGPHLVQPGDVCPVGALLVELYDSPAIPSTSEPAREPKSLQSAFVGGAAMDFEASGKSSEHGTPKHLAEVGSADATPPASAPDLGQMSRTKASPKARELAKELNIDLRQIAGSGPNGLVVESDVRSQSLSTAWADRRVRRALTPTQIMAADRLAKSWTSAPHFVQMVDVDFSRLQELRQQWAEKGGAVARITWNDILIAAYARTLARFPDLNARIEGKDLVLSPEVNLGIAMESERGLLVPVLAEANRFTLIEISTRLAEMILTQAGDAAAGTATFSNLGKYGIRMGTPVLNMGELVLLFSGSIEPRPAVVGHEVVVRTMGTLSVAYDHRAVEGAQGARFLSALRHRLEYPDEYL